jgi:hypothetical protein
VNNVSSSVRKKTDTPKKTNKPPTSSQKEAENGFCWTWTPSPAPFFEQPLEILPYHSHQRLTIYALQPPQAKAPHAMPVFAFRKQELHPDMTLAQSFFVGLGRVVASDPIQILLIDTAAEAAALGTVRTLRFERAVIAMLCVSSIAQGTFSRMGRKHGELQFEEDHWINGRTPAACIGLLHKIPHKGEIQRALQVEIEVILWY